MDANAPLTSLNFTNLSNNTSNTSRPGQKIIPLARLGAFHILLIDHHKTLESKNLTIEAARTSISKLDESSKAIEEYLKNGPLSNVNEQQEVDYKEEINISDRENNLKKAKWVFTEYQEILRKAQENYAKYIEDQPVTPDILPTNTRERERVLQRLAFSIDHDQQINQNSQFDMSLYNSTTTFTFAALIMAISAIAMYCLFISNKNR